MVAQCPSCQSKFRIADEKVTERGVRVRCSSCKAVFQVRRPGSDEPLDPAPDPAGTTLELHGFETGRIPTGKVRAPSSPPGRKPTTAPLAGPGAAAARGAAQAARRLDADDLFGMDELTGEADPQPGSPLATPPRPAPAPAEPSAESFSFGDLHLEDEPAAAEAPAAPAAPPPRARTGRTAPVLLRSEDAGDRAASSPGGHGTGPVEDSFGDLELDRPAAEAPLEISSSAPASPPAPAAPPEPRADARPDPRTEPPQPPATRARASAVSRASAGPDSPALRTEAHGLAAGALTGVLAAAVVLAGLLAAGALGGTPEGARSMSASGEVVANNLTSGLYDTAAGRPVFFVRGTLENHGSSPRGPFRVIAELVAEGGGADARGEAFAGAVPTPEEVHGLADDAAIDEFARGFSLSAAQTPIPAGQSLPFFALIAEPPRDLRAHTLRVRAEAAEAGAPPPRATLKPAK